MFIVLSVSEEMLSVSLIGTWCFYVFTVTFFFSEEPINLPDDHRNLLACSQLLSYHIKVTDDTLR